MFDDIKLGTKLIVGFLFVALIAALGLGSNMISQGSVNSKMSQFQNYSLKVVILAQDMQKNVIQVQQFLQDIAATRGLNGMDDGPKLAEENAVAFLARSAELEQLYTQAKDTKSLALVAELKIDFEKFYTVGKKMSQEYVSGGPEKGNALMAEFDPYAVKMSAAMESLVLTEKNKMDRDLSLVQEQGGKAFMASFITVIICVILAIFLGLMFTGSIMKAIMKIINVMENMASGYLTLRLKEKRKDELGIIAGVLDAFAESLSGLIGQVKGTTEKFAAGAKEISSNSQQIADGAQQQSASFEELSTSVQSNAENVQRASRIAKDGR